MVNCLTQALEWACVNNTDTHVHNPFCCPATAVRVSRHVSSAVYDCLQVRVPIELDSRLPAVSSEWSALPPEVLQQQQQGSWNPVMFDAVVATPSAPPMP